MQRLCPQQGLSLPVADLVIVPPPETAVFRVARGLDPFALPPWERADDDGTFGNRFDDPRGDLPVADRFRTLYFATQRSGAFGETIARFRPSLALIEALVFIEDEEPLPASFEAPRVDEAWRLRRTIGCGVLDPTLTFVDIAAGATLSHLRTALAAELLELGLDDLDLSGATGPLRRLTQKIALYVHQNGHAGIRYLSRLNQHWECWAVFDNSLIFNSTTIEPILITDAALREAADLFGLGVD